MKLNMDTNHTEYYICCNSWSLRNLYVNVIDKIIENIDYLLYVNVIDKIIENIVYLLYVNVIDKHELVSHRWLFATDCFKRTGPLSSGIKH